MGHKRRSGIYVPLLHVCGTSLPSSCALRSEPVARSISPPSASAFRNIIEMKLRDACCSCSRGKIVMNVLKKTAIAGAIACAMLQMPAMAQRDGFWQQQKNSVYDKRTVSFSKDYRPGKIIVSFSDRRLHHVTAGEQAISYSIAFPRAQRRYQRSHRVSRKAVNPSWTPTARMRCENLNLPSFVSGSHRRNPMSVRALYLGSTLSRIHGMDAPRTIGKNVSKG